MTIDNLDVQPGSDASGPMRAVGSAPPPALAEGRWLWRRIFVFAVCGGLLGLLALALRQADQATLPHIAEGLTHLIALVLILYLVAPTAQQIIELLAGLKLRLATGGEG